MKIEVAVQPIRIPFNKFKEVLPKPEHLEKLSKIPFELNCNRRLISVDIKGDILKGYLIHDWKDDLYKRNRYVTIEELEK